MKAPNNEAREVYPVEPSRESIWSEIAQCIDHLLNMQPPKEFTLFTSGTGIPDETWIEYYKDTNIPIIARDGSMWRKGERVK